MTEKLNTLLADIRSRSMQLASDLQNERSAHQSLLEEKQKLETLFNEEQIQVAQLKEQIEELKTSLTETNNKVEESPVVVNSRNAAQIDALVKEIEFCIEKLKQS